MFPNLHPFSSRESTFQWLFTVCKYLEYINKIPNILLDYVINYLKRNGKDRTSVIIGNDDFRKGGICLFYSLPSLKLEQCPAYIKHSMFM